MLVSKSVGVIQSAYCCPDLPPGSRYKMNELQRMVTAEPWRIWGVDSKEEGYVHFDPNNLSSDSDDDGDTAAEKRRRRNVKEKLIGKLIEHRKRRAKSTRITHRGTAHDIEQTKSLLMTEVRILNLLLYAR